MVHNISTEYSVLSDFVAELRDKSVQADRMRFRYNLERIGEIMAYEISKHLPYKEVITQTPLGEANCKVMKEQPVLATILRAGLPFHQGMLKVFDKADNAFISAYRKHINESEEDFVIEVEYISCPDLTDRVLILADPMLATGASIVSVLKHIQAISQPKEIHVVSLIASVEGIDYVERHLDHVKIWTAAIDEELTAKGYIVPGLGDAGDLSYGEKMQH